MDIIICVHCNNLIKLSPFINDFIKANTFIIELETLMHFTWKIAT